MIKRYSLFANWRKQDVQFLNQFNLSRKIEEGYFGIAIEEGEVHDKIINHFYGKDSLFRRIKPPEFSNTFASVVFSEDELEKANSYTLHLGRGKLDYYWDDANLWKKYLYDSVCERCGLPLGKQKHPWVLKKDFKQVDKYRFVSFEGLGGFVFCGKELATMINREFGIGHFEVLIGKQQKVSEYLVQLAIPLSQHKLFLDASPYGQAFEEQDLDKKAKEAIPCSTCGQKTLTNQSLDFFPSFEKDFAFDMVLTQEWFGWFRRIVVSRRFLDFCFERKMLKKWGFSGVIIPQK